MEVNRAYASKLAKTTELFLLSSQKTLAYSADSLSNKMQDSNWLQTEANRLKFQIDSFNSVVISDNTGLTKAASPETLNLVGRKLTSAGSVRALEEKRAFISEAYISTLKNLIVVLFSPIYGEGQEYLGFVSGSIYLKDDNILKELLGEHYYKNGSYIYVVDREQRILYHPNKARIGEIVTDNTGMARMQETKEGGVLLTNSQGIDMLAGYADVPSTGWIVVTQSPLESSLLPLTGIMEQVILRTMPLAMLAFIFIWFFARAISEPLQQLADKARHINSPNVSVDIENINTWYMESLKLKKALLSGVKLIETQIFELRKDADTDPLTGADNRRSLMFRLNQFSVSEMPFVVLALDIDHFKRVNDTFGHPIGDEVLKRMTDIIRSFSRANDMVARTGGEEFVLVLKSMDVKNAYKIAERLRLAVFEEEFKTVGHISVSIGIAHWRVSDSITIDETLSLADKSLYQAKQNGRNQCVIAS
ncbi:sensor domain-containing diguanylate cyclase [Marinomonas algarum]|uniref:diguanylate cyclase n=1 Tax=Marinomonas algarum TaxID=2883105 RepID=A0A9X1IL99_9GAMM|nr:sensor domain-containing diguanylate cyclase [Marinomonas algarum]MCB5160356.1 sensor domain-containing diguanylate cyclase [Marinomonas algarum]